MAANVSVVYAYGCPAEWEQQPPSIAGVVQAYHCWGKDQVQNSESGVY